MAEKHMGLSQFISNTVGPIKAQDYRVSTGSAFPQ